MKRNILLVGPGLIGLRHIELIQSHSRCRLIGIVAPDTSVNREKAKDLNVAFYSTLEGAFNELNDTCIHGVMICSPNQFHFNQTRFCIKNDIPVFVEKPLAANIFDARTLMLESEKRNSKILVGHHRTYSALINGAKTFLDTPQFGKMVGVMGSAQFYKPDHYFRDAPWRTRKGGGPLLINLIHEIGVMRALCGEISSVGAISSNATREFEVEDTVAITLRFCNGALGTFLLSDTAASDKSWELTSGENPSYPRSLSQTCYHFTGTRGSLDFPTMEAKFYDLSQPQSWWSDLMTKTLSVSDIDPLCAQLDHFVEVISSNADPIVTARDGFLNMLVIDAIGLSIERQNVVHIADHDLIVEEL